MILEALSDGKPKSSAEIARSTGLESDAVWAALRRYWQASLILRSTRPLREQHYAFKGRKGITRNLRAYHLYMLKPRNIDSLVSGNIKFVSYRSWNHSNSKIKSKASSIFDFLKINSHRAYFATEIVEILSKNGIKPSDVMSNVRKWERKGFVLVRGYRLDEKQTPFKEGYLIAWLDPSIPREEAIEDAVEKTEQSLVENEATNPTIQRVHRIRDIILESSKLRELVSISYICDSLECSKCEAEVAMNRALQLYPDLREIRLFNAFRYFYHESLIGPEFNAAKTMKENYIRIVKGKANRIGHNWEAVAEWFIDKFTTGAHFWIQNHRTRRMDPRRITIHLFKNVRGRRRNAEVDRVWDVTPGIFSPSITYVLSCKWGIVFKRDIDDFFDVLRWSKEFGVNTPNGREIKQSIVGVFAGSAFNPNEKMQLKDGDTVSLASYAARMNVQLLKTSDFNDKLHQRGCPLNVSVQKICKAARDEKQVREILEYLWKAPKKSEQVLLTTSENNREVYELEKLLET
jgi:DNA-binding Lrp family transcriptional regulator